MNVSADVLTPDIRLTGDFVLIKPLDKSKEVRGGIVIESSEKKIGEGVLVLVGSGKLTPQGHPLPVGMWAGDHVFYNLLAETPFSYEGEDFGLMAAGDIIAIKNKKTNF